MNINEQGTRACLGGGGFYAEPAAACKPTYVDLHGGRRGDVACKDGAAPTPASLARGEKEGWRGVWRERELDGEG